jgi:hypothetical protein
MGNAGVFVREAYDYINQTYHEGGLPPALVLWALTAHGHCLGLTKADRRKMPLILLHPSTLGGTEKANPWGKRPDVLGRCYAYDVLFHECIHVKVEYVLGGWRGKPLGASSHNNPLWVGEVNRLAPVLGLGGIKASVSRARRVPIPGQTSKTGKPASRVVRGTEGDVPFDVISRFPYSFRSHLGLTDYYVRNELPFPCSAEFRGRGL